MYLFDGSTLDIFDECFDLLHALMSIYHFLVVHPILDNHQFLPIFECSRVFVCIVLSISSVQKCFKYVDKLTLHQEVSHSFDNIMVSASG